MFDLSNRISSLRKQNNLSQKQLADKLHVSNQVVSKWEQGKSEPSASMLKDIASVFGMGLAEFLEEESVKSPSDLNSKVASFFSKYYMLVIQIFLVWAANIVNAIFIGFLIGKDIVIDILPTYMLWLILLFTFVLSIIQTILYLIKSQGKTIAILKFCLLTFYLTLLICGFVFLASTPDKNSHDLFLSIGISYSILFVSLVLDILVGFDIIKNKKPFALGSIAFVFFYCLYRC